MTDMREAVARMIDPSTWAGLDSYLADVKRKYAKSNAGYDPDKFKDRKSLAIADAILEAVLENPWREHLLSLLRHFGLALRFFDVHWCAVAGLGFRKWNLRGVEYG